MTVYDPWEKNLILLHANIKGADQTVQMSETHLLFTVEKVY